jgi:hypothetical protein
MATRGSGGARSHTPEERELDRKRAELLTLQGALTDQELALATLHGQLRAFDARYTRTVGHLFRELDELEAQLAGVDASVGDPVSQALASNAFAQAHASARRQAGDVGASGFAPSDDLKKLYREAAKHLHPDLTTDEAERERRTGFMTRVNRAYETGDQAALEAVLGEWHESPEAIKGDDAIAELVRVIRQIAQVERRLKSIKHDFKELRVCSLFRLQCEVEDATRLGRDALADIAAGLEKKIRDAREELERRSGLSE